MPSIFLSYAHNDPVFSQIGNLTGSEPLNLCFIESLKQLGYEVWWDHFLENGDPIRETIEAEIRNAHAVILAATASSTETKSFCREECICARAYKIPYLPIVIEKFDPKQADDIFSDTLTNFEKPLMHIQRNRWPGIIADQIREKKKITILSELTDITYDQRDIDPYAIAIYPPYKDLGTANKENIINYIERCKNRLAINSKSSFHNINLALLLAEIGDIKNAVHYAKMATEEHPDKGEVFYFAALIALAKEHIKNIEMSRMKSIENLLDQATKLGFPSTLPTILFSLIDEEHYRANGMTPPSNRLISKNEGQVPAEELERLKKLLRLSFT